MFYLLPDPELTDISKHASDRLKAAADFLIEGSLDSFLDAAMETHLRAAFTSIKAHEGTIWLLDSTGKHLIPRFNSGPNAEKLMTQLSQDVSKGIISMVFAVEDTFHSNQVYNEPSHDGAVDKALKTITCSIVAVPFGFAEKTRGVISAVTLKQGPEMPDPVPIGPEAAGQLGAAAVVLGRLFEHKLLGLLFGDQLN